MTRTLDADYLVVGAGAMGMAFADAVIDHSDARVVMVDRRHGVGGHWLEAYPFVRLHQSSAFYGVASTMLGGGALQESGPEAGLQERATQPEITAYYGRVLDRLVRTGRLEFFPNSDHRGDRTVVSRISGDRFEVPQSCRIVNAHYLAPSIPAEQPPPFDVGNGARVVPVNDLARLDEAPSEFVVVGSGKTATDTIIWLLGRGVDPDAICWIRSREPWMLNRARVQPDPAIFLGLAADIMQSAASATTLDDLFLRMEDADVMMRIDRSVTPTMAKAPTLAKWELDQLRTVDNVVRRGHVRAVDRGQLHFADGSVRVADDSLVVHCAADGLKQPPLIPVWRPDVITLQPIRAGFPPLERRSQVSSRPPAPTTTRRTGSARPPTTATHWPTGRACSIAVPGRPCPSRRSRTSGRGRTGSPSTRPASRRGTRPPSRWTTPASASPPTRLQAWRGSANWARQRTCRSRFPTALR